jgi:peroxiredoxin
VEFLGVNVKDQRPLALAFVANKGLEFPSLFDTGGSVALQLRQTPPNAIPSTLVLDRRHRVAAVWLGPVAAEQLQPVVTALAEEAA